MPGNLLVTAEPQGSAHLFAALGDETRLRLVARLCDSGPMSIARLTEGSKVTRQAITKHLRLMEGSGLVSSTRHGRESVWQLDRRRLEEARRYLDAISQQWDDALLRLRDFVEKGPVDG
jgi:DNA-binding transcriptional ArsR family regulator